MSKHNNQANTANDQHNSTANNKHSTNHNASTNTSHNASTNHGAHKQTLSFQTEVKQLLNLMIHSLYSNKEIFLRELISNASDAIDKLKFAQINNPSLAHSEELCIKVLFDKDAHTITIEDNGIGMTYDEVIENIGTIAKSGTKAFLEQLTGDSKTDNNLIGQFGVGFYSAFIVAHKVELFTKKAGLASNSATYWTSDGSGEYTIENINQEQNGTKVILHLKKEDNDDLLSDWQLRSLIRKYSDHISYPIKMLKIATTNDDFNGLDGDMDTDTEGNEHNSDSDSATNDALDNNSKIIDAEYDATDDEAKQAKASSKDSPKEQGATHEQVVTNDASSDDKQDKPKEFETINQASALWVRNKNDITEEEYKEFYKHISHDFREPMKWLHSRVEGTQEYIQLLYIPSAAPYDLYDHQKRYGLKLFIKRVFIMDDAEKLLPNYLRFVRGIIDSQNLPLNVSREILQSSKDIDAIRSGCTKKILGLIEDIANNDLEGYAKFYKEFGNVLKEGIIEDHANKDRIAKLLRFSSTYNDNDTKNVSLESYIGRMQPKQQKIYYITAETYNSAKHSPHLEIFKKKDIEVLLLTDKIDEWLVGHLFEFSGKQLASVAKGDLDLGDLTDKVDDVTKPNANEVKPVLEKIKNVLGDKVKEVKLTDRLVDSPSCLVVDNMAMSMHLERLLQQAGQAVPNSKPTLEINPQHVLFKKLEASTDDSLTHDLANILFEQAMLSEGLKLDDPAHFIMRMNKLIAG